MGPADERLGAGEGPGVEAKQRLVDDEQLRALERLYEVRTKAGCRFGAEVDLGVEKLEAVATGSLGAVQGDIGAAQQFGRVDARIVCDHDPEAAGDVQLAAADHHRLADRPDDAIGDQAHVLVVAEVRAQHHKLVAAKACNGVDPARHVGQAPADLQQDLVTGVVAE